MSFLVGALCASWEPVGGADSRDAPGSEHAEQHNGRPEHRGGGLALCMPASGAKVPVRGAALTLGTSVGALGDSGRV